jgi:hypothetical protein
MIAYDYDRRRFGKAKYRLEDDHLEGLMNGTPVTLYHGTTRLFRTFSLDKSRDDLVNEYYGRGIFLTPSKRVAEKYANANRNIGFDASIIDDLKRKNPNAGAFLKSLYDHGTDAWEIYPKERGLWDPAVGYSGGWFEEHLGVDSNTLQDIADYIIGSKSKPLAASGPVNIFNMSSGMESGVYYLLDEVGLNSKVYRPKVYTVSVTVSNPLITASKSKASKARSQGHDSVVYHGTDLVSGVTEVAVFNPRNVKVKKIEVV